MGKENKSKDPSYLRFMAHGQIGVIAGRWLDDTHPEKEPLFYPKTDIGAGRTLAMFCTYLARYVPERRKWYVYLDGIWTPDISAGEVMEICKELAGRLLIYAAALPDTKHGGNDENKAAYLKHVLKWQSRSYRRIIVDDAASVLPVPASAFDQKPDLFNCKNGTLDLSTMEFRKHDPVDFLTVMAGVKYDPKAKCTRWVQFIDEVTQGDKELARYLQKAMGYGLCGQADEECLFILYGPTTRNGKSTAMEVYMKLVGGYGRTAEPETISQRQHTNSSAPSEDLARLAGARVVNISEPEKQLVLSAARVKTLTGNDIVTARFLHENSFEFKPQFKLFINTNHLPRVNDLTVFSSGRAKVIPFNRHFTEAEQDRGLKRKLTTEKSLSGILNWCLEGLQLMRKEGLEAPPAVVDAVKQYQKDSDKIARFMDETMTPDPAGEILTTDAYQKYNIWCGQNGHYPESMPNFKQAMERYVEIKRKRPAGAARDASKQAFILGMKWREGILGFQEVMPDA